MTAMMVRCDNGGLGAMCWEAWRHLQPARTLVVRSRGPACGSPHPDRYGGGPGEVRLAGARPTTSDLQWLCEAGVVYGAETWYNPAIQRIAATRARTTVLHVMPEYYDAAIVWADVLLAPTTWMAPPGATLLPVPVATDRFAARHVDEVRTIYHVGSPAPAQDRNGTQLLLAALPLLANPARILIRQAGARPHTETVGLATVEWLPHHDGPYWEAWPADADALVMPRRFAGLSLPIQEAAALGLPIIGLDREPESTWLPPSALVPARVAGWMVTWRNLKVDYWDAPAASLAAKIDELTTSPTLAADLSAASRAWAETLAWGAWVDRYREVLG